MDVRGARRWQTLAEAERLLNELGEWISYRKSSDTDASGYRGRYDTQLKAISSQVEEAVNRVRLPCESDRVETRPQGQVCQDYNLHDQRLIWIRYAWDYFRDKLDQRDNGSLRPLLEAADEVSWSCYSTFFQSMDINPVPAAPIPYIEYDYVPSALRTGQSHVLNRKPGSESGPLNDYFQSLPVPLLRLPPTVVNAPWTLTLICHEVGHLIQGYIEPDLAFFSTFTGLVSDAVKQTNGEEQDQKRWSAWSQEIFADLCMASSAGPWGVWALAPWVLTCETEMNKPLEKYPPPIIRLYLLDQFAQQANLPSASEILTYLGLNISQYPLAHSVGEIANRTLTVNGRELKLPELLGCLPSQMTREGRIHQWSEQLLGEDEIVEQHDRTAARDAAVAVARAHFHAIRSGKDLKALRDRAIPFIRSCFATGRRAPMELAPPAKSLADTLFELQNEQLLGSLST